LASSLATDVVTSFVGSSRFTIYGTVARETQRRGTSRLAAGHGSFTQSDADGRLYQGGSGVRSRSARVTVRATVRNTWRDNASRVSRRDVERAQRCVRVQASPASPPSLRNRACILTIEATQGWRMGIRHIQSQGKTEMSGGQPLSSREPPGLSPGQM
jgi:hypothetical protein